MRASNVGRSTLHGGARWGGLALAAAAALALGACGSAAGDSGGEAAKKAAAGSETGASAVPVVDVLDVGEVPTDVEKDVTRPGEKLAFDETAWFDSKTNSHEILGTTVRDVVELDPKSIDGFSGNPEFDQFTSYGVIVQYDWKPKDSADAGRQPIVIEPFDAAGDGAPQLANSIGMTALGSANSCGVQLPENRAGTMMSCVVAMGTSNPIVGARYIGATSPGGVAFGPYATDPVTWTK